MAKIDEIERARRAVQHANMTRQRVIALQNRLRQAGIAASDARIEMMECIPDGYAVKMPVLEIDDYELV